MSDEQESLGSSDTVMLDTDLDGTNGFSIVGPSEDAYAGSAVAGAGVRTTVKAYCAVFRLAFYRSIGFSDHRSCTVM